MHPFAAATVNEGKFTQLEIILSFIPEKMISTFYSHRVIIIIGQIVIFIIYKESLILKSVLPVDSIPLK